jgi:hypothetical protein
MLRCGNRNQNEVCCLRNLQCVTPDIYLISSLDRQAFNTALASTLSKSVHTMLTHTSSERGRTAVPLITNASGISPFPVKVTVKVGGVELGGG